MSIQSQKARKRRQRRIRRHLSGTAGRPRLNVFRSARNIYAQVIDDESGRTLAAASTVEKSVVADTASMSKKDQAAHVGKLVAERAKSAGIGEVIFDRGGFVYHGRVKALADGAREGGLKF